METRKDRAGERGGLGSKGKEGFEQRNPSPRWKVPLYSSMIVCSGSTLPLSRAACEGSGLEGRELAGVG